MTRVLVAIATPLRDAFPRRNYRTLWIVAVPRFRLRDRIEPPGNRMYGHDNTIADRSDQHQRERLDMPGLSRRCDRAMGRRGGGADFSCPRSLNEVEHVGLGNSTVCLDRSQDRRRTQAERLGPGADGSVFRLTVASGAMQANVPETHGLVVGEFPSPMDGSRIRHSSRAERAEHDRLTLVLVGIEPIVVSRQENELWVAVRA
jgi:hypothetical protein